MFLFPVLVSVGPTDSALTHKHINFLVGKEPQPVFLSLGAEAASPGRLVTSLPSWPDRGSDREGRTSRSGKLHRLSGRPDPVGTDKELMRAGTAASFV